MRTLAPLRRKLAILTADPERAERFQIPVGGLVGLGSFLYGLLKIGELLDEPSLIREAHVATILITPKRIARDCQVRIQTGCAGAILALLALHARLSEPDRLERTPLDIACECAQRLLETRISFEGRPRAWALSPGKPPLGGFSYGAAGVCYALLRLFEATGRQDLLDAAHEGLSFVRDLYSPEHGCWRDFRPVFQSRYRPRRGTWRDWWAAGSFDDLEKIPEPLPVENHFPLMWCHGAVGIALGRIGALHLEDTPEARQEIDGVLNRVKSYVRDTKDLESADDLCCGHMGLLELLLCASRKMGDEDALDAALILMDRVRRRAEERGGCELTAARGRTSLLHPCSRESRGSATASYDSPRPKQSLARCYWTEHDGFEHPGDLSALPRRSLLYAARRRADRRSCGFRRRRPPVPIEGDHLSERSDERRLMLVEVVGLVPLFLSFLPSI